MNQDPAQTPPETAALNGQGAEPTAPTRRRTRTTTPRATTPRATTPRATTPRATRAKKAPAGELDISGLVTPEDDASAEGLSATMETAGSVPATEAAHGQSSPNGASPATERPVAPAVTERPPRRGGVSPENTVFVSLCFEGPDVYSMAGGLGTRVTEFTETLAALGYETHLIFVGDPNKPAQETLVNGKLHLKRWSQWISKYYPNGVYDGEDHKLYDYNESVPYHVYNEIARPAIEQGKIVVIIGEDWHTAEAVSRCSDLLHWHNLRHRCILMWNCNSLMSLHRINWGRLNFTSTITTVSRYMKHKLWAYSVNPLVIPNGIPHRYLETVNGQSAQAVREAAQRGNPERLFLFKIGRFDPDKRWLMAVEAAARLKYSGHPLSMVVRGGIEPHGGEVLGRARHIGLTVKDIEARRPSVEECIALLRDAGEADIYNLRFFVPEEFVRLCYASADAVLANSGHEPFGLVGLEVMAAHGLAFTGSTGEDYALSFENAIALETEDPDEIVGYLLYLKQHPEEREKIRGAGHETAAEFTWEEAIDNLSGKIGYLARKQSILFE
jgi:glycosyltransferase involved in cell wall biosynthesis